MKRNTGGIIACLLLSFCLSACKGKAEKNKR